MRQRKTISELQTLLNKNKTETEEKKSDFNNKNQKYLAKVLTDLNSETEQFRHTYNTQKLQEIFDKSPQTLIQNNSSMNREINEYNKNNKNIILLSQSFNKYINDTQAFIHKIAIPNIAEYKQRNLEQIMAWIVSLENGKYVKYAKKLREGFVKSGILSGDLLPELTRYDLSNPPFSINDFRVKRDLETYFKSLATNNAQNIIAFADNEGGDPQYI